MSNKFKRFWNAVVPYKITHADTYFEQQRLIINSENRSYNSNSDTISTLITCQKILSEKISTMPLEVYFSSKQKGKEKLKNHRLYRTLHNRVNNWQTSNTFKNAMEYTRNQNGNAFALIHRLDYGKIQLQYLHPDNIKGAKIENGYLKYITKDNKEIDNSDILHFKGLVTDNKLGLFGLNPVQALYQNLDNMFQGQTTLNSSYKNGLNTDRVFKSKLNNANKEEVKKVLKELEVGSANANKVQLIPYDSEIVTLPKPTIQDSDILNSLKFQKLEIASLFGIPAWMLNINEGAQYKDIEQSFIAFKVNTISPIARMYRQELENKLLFDNEIDNNISIEFNMNSLVEGDMITRSNYLGNLTKSGIMKLSAAAQIEGLEVSPEIDYNFLQSQNQPLQIILKDGEYKPVTNGSTNNNDNKSKDDE